MDFKKAIVSVFGEEYENAWEYKIIMKTIEDKIYTEEFMARIIASVKYVYRIVYICEFTTAVYMYDQGRTLTINAMRKLGYSIETACLKRIIDKFAHGSVLVCADWGCEEFSQAYARTCGMLLSIINDGVAARNYPADHGSLMNRLISGTLSASNIFDINLDAYYPSTVAEETADIARKKEASFVQKVSVLYTCPKCKGSECTWVSVQTRSIDEAADIICTCENPTCRHRFKGY
jgi:DNA-directed RNA polymerase subunit M/transcription elongation factor TFIIS